MHGFSRRWALTAVVWRGTVRRRSVTGCFWRRSSTAAASPSSPCSSSSRPSSSSGVSSLRSSDNLPTDASDCLGVVTLHFSVLWLGLQEKSRNHDHREYRDSGSLSWFLAIAVIWRHGRDYRRIMYRISTVKLLWRQFDSPFNGGIQC